MVKPENIKGKNKIFKEVKEKGQNSYKRKLDYSKFLT